MEISRYAAVLLLTVASAGAHAQLWQETRQGMTAEQVQALMPGVERRAVPSALPSGAQCLLRLPGVQIAGADFTADFCFLSGGLSAVQLSAKAPTADMESVHKRVVEALRAKYGQEVSRGGMAGFSSHGTWVQGRTSIELSAFYIGASGHLYVTYSGATAANADKL